MVVVNRCQCYRNADSGFRKNNIDIDAKMQSLICFVWSRDREHRWLLMWTGC